MGREKKKMIKSLIRFCCFYIFFLLSFLFSIQAEAGSSNALLYKAIKKCDIEKIKVLLSNDVAINQKTKRRNSPLKLTLKFCLEEDKKLTEDRALEILMLLFDSGAVISSGDWDLLDYVAVYGGVEVGKLLIAKGADINAGEGKRTPLVISIERNKPQITELLLANGATPLPVKDQIQLEFTKSVVDGDLDSAIKYLKKGAKINGRDEYYVERGATALAIAADSQNYEMVKFLLSKSADPNIKGAAFLGTNTAPPLWYATYKNAKWSFNKKIFDILIEYGARVSSKDYLYKRTPLHLAAQYHNIYAAEKLIENGAKVMAKDGSGNTPLDLAEDGRIIKMLKKAGATESM